jgi:dUTP pyrophosphatase
MNITVRVKAVQPEFVPVQQSAHSSGYDLKAAVETAVSIAPGERRLVPTGIRLEIPEGFEGQVRPRSGLALRHGITLLNSPGTIDADYRGDVGVILYNTGGADFIIQPGDRIAQIVFCSVPSVEMKHVEMLHESERGEGGFGSTGT